MTTAPNVHPLVRVGTAAHFQLYNRSWHRTENYPGKCTCGINPMTADIVKPSLDDSWRYVPDTAWGPCISKLVKHEEAQVGILGGNLMLKDHTPLALGLRVVIDPDAAALYEEGQSGEWYVESIGRPVDGEPSYAIVRLRELKTQVYYLAPSHWLTTWKPPAPKEEPVVSFDDSHDNKLSLAFALEPTTDDNITCFLCHKDDCTHEFTFRGMGNRTTIGSHMKCMETIQGADVTVIK